MLTSENQGSDGSVALTGQWTMVVSRAVTALKQDLLGRLQDVSLQAEGPNRLKQSVAQSDHGAAVSPVRAGGPAGEPWF